MLNDSIVDGRALREVYLLAFEKAVREAEPWTVMGAYNKLNGIYCCEHPDLLTDILRREWGGFAGAVLSDWGGRSMIRCCQSGQGWIWKCPLLMARVPPKFGPI